MNFKKITISVILLSSVFLPACMNSTTGVNPSTSPSSGASNSPTTAPTATTDPSATVAPTAAPATGMSFTTTLLNTEEVPPVSSNARGSATITLSADEKSATVNLTFQDLSSEQTDAHIHGPGAKGVTAPVLFPLAKGPLNNFKISNLTPEQVTFLKEGKLYINVHSNKFPSGEIRGQF